MGLVQAGIFCIWPLPGVGVGGGGVLLGASGQAVSACCGEVWVPPAGCLCKPPFHQVNLHSFFPGQPGSGTQNLPRCDSTKLIPPFSVFPKQSVYLVPLW